MRDALLCLEYGKLCESAEGPILKHADTGILATSPEFPALLRSACSPRWWGFSDKADAIQAAQRFGGSVIVAPFRAAGSIFRVGAHFRRRPEDGEGKTGRAFWRARFVCDKGATTELFMLEAALSRPPLLGWTATDSLGAAAECDSSIETSFDDAARLADEESRTWRDRALRALEQGLTIGVEGSASRTRFFALARALEAALPEPLRPLLSLGWGVSPAWAAHLTLACCERFAPGTLVYDSVRRAWSPTSDNGRLVQERTGDGAPLEGPEHGDESPARILLFSDDEVQNSARSALRSAAVDRRLRALDKWLEGATPEAPREVAASLLDSPQTLDAELKRAAQSLADPGRASRAEALLSELLKGPGRTRVGGVLAAADAPADARLLAALVDRDPRALLAALRRTDAPLPPWARGQIEGGLDRTLVADEDIAAGHAALLMRVSGDGGEYARWAAQNGRQLGLLLAAAAPSELREASLRSLEVLSDSPEVALVRAILFDDAGDVAAARARLAVAPSWHRVLTQLVSRRWSSTAAPAADRSAALRWLRALDASPDDPLLRQGRPDALEAAAIADALAQKRVPEELFQPLAVRVLRFWPDFAIVRTQTSTVWEDVVRLWPAAAARLLLPDLSTGSSRDREPDMEIRGALDQLALSANLLEQVGQRAGGAGLFSNPDAEAAARLFVELCGRAVGAPSPGSLVEVVRWLWHGAESPATGPSDATARMARSLLRQVPVPREVLESCWREARSSTPILLLLSVAQEPLAEPSVRQLISVLASPRQLRALAGRIQDPVRLGLASLCTHGWQDLDWNKGDHQKEWRRDFAGTLLSGLFAGLPHSQEAPLREMLDFFSVREERSRWALASHYLERRGGRADTETIDLVWREVVEVACLKAGVDLEGLAVLLALGDPEARPKRTRMRVDLVPGQSEAITVAGRNNIFVEFGFARLLAVLGDSLRREQRYESYKELRVRQTANVRRVVP